MGKTLEEKLNELPLERRQRIEQRTAELIAEELSLRDLRKALNLTQEQLAEQLQIRQEGVSRLEQRTDLLLSTLQKHVAAMGGELQLIVQFPDRPPVRLSGLSEPTMVEDRPSAIELPAADQLAGAS